MWGFVSLTWRYWASKENFWLILFPAKFILTKLICLTNSVALSSLPLSATCQHFSTNRMTFLFTHFSLRTADDWLNLLIQNMILCFQAKPGTTVTCQATSSNWASASTRGYRPCSQPWQEKSLACFWNSPQLRSSSCWPQKTRSGRRLRR